MNATSPIATLLLLSIPALAPAAEFRFDDIDGRSMKLSEGDRPVLTYNYGVITGEHVPEKDHYGRRACYIHPLWGLDGEVLTDDFPPDHYHHHGVFWTWPHIAIDGKHYDSWSGSGLEQRFVRWLSPEVDSEGATLAIENEWLVGERKVMSERVRVRVHPADDDLRKIDIDLAWTPIERPITLKGADGKSYGGLTVRLNVWPRRDGIVTHPGGVIRHEGKDSSTAGDLADKRLPWADITTQIPDAPGRSGVAVFVSPEHPDYPPTWLTRCYGALCVGWPGVERKTFEPGKEFCLSYRLLVHRGQWDIETIKDAYED